MIRRKIIFSSSEIVNNKLNTRKDAYCKSNINADSESCSKLKEEQKNYFNGIEIADYNMFDKMPEILEENVERNIIIYTYKYQYGFSCKESIMETMKYLKEYDNCIVLPYFDMEQEMRVHFYDDIYQIIAEYIGFYIMYEMSEKKNSIDGIIVCNMLDQILSTKKIRKSEIKQRYDMLVAVIDDFLEKMVGDTNKKIIFPIYFNHNPPFSFLKAFDMIEKVKSRKIVFFIGTVAPKKFWLEELKHKENSNIRIIF